MAKPKPNRPGPTLGQEVIALAILGTGILLLLALFSFDPRDLSFYSQPPQNPKANLVGPAGAYLGGILFLLFGLGSYLFPVVFIAGGLLLFFAKEVRYSQKFIFLGILLVTGACLLQLAAPVFGPSLANPLCSGAQGLDGAPSAAGKMPGGYIGYFLNDKFLAPILGQVGAVLVFGLSYLVVLVLLFEFRPAELARAFGEAGRALVDQYLDYKIRQAQPTERLHLEQKKIEIAQKRLRRAIEVANASKIKVLLRDLIESPEWTSSTCHLPISLGKDVYGATLVDDLADLPHLLIAGTTGSGKSVCINTLLLSLLYRFSPDDLRLILIDPKVVELQVYNRLPHLVVPVVTEPKKVLLALRWVINEMEKRYRYMAKATVRNIVSFNTRTLVPKRIEALDLAPRLENGDEPETASSLPSNEEVLPDRLPYIVVIIDELANLMQVAPAEVENAIALLSAKARAAGIHLVIATQTPRAAVITGVIKTNVPARIAFQVPSGVDSRVILDESGAENLLGKGDLLYLRPGASKLIRAQGAFVTEEEVSRVIDFIAEQSKPFYEQEIHAKLTKPSGGDSDLSEKDEDLLSRSLEVVKLEKKASTSLLQRRLGVGYGRAAWVIDQFEARGMIGPKDGAKDREILVDLDTVQL